MGMETPKKWEFPTHNLRIICCRNFGKKVRKVRKKTCKNFGTMIAPFQGCNMKGYLPRLIEERIQQQMKAAGCVVIEGPKWCGKSTTAKRYSRY